MRIQRGDATTNLSDNSCALTFRRSRFAATYLVAVLMVTVSGCGPTITPEERAAYEKAPAVDVYGEIGDKTGVVMKTRPMVTQRFVIEMPSNARAIVLFFSGRDGMGGHTADLEYDLPKNGIGFANISPPSDLTSGFASGGRRSSTDHVTDIEFVIDYVRLTYGSPVWLAGLSMGTVSVANVATSSRKPIDGVIFMSPITSRGFSGRGNLRGESLVTEFSLNRLKVPILAIGHQGDGCAGTPPHGTREIVNSASQARVKKATILSGGRDYGQSGCVVGPHTFAGSEKKLARTIVEFIVANSDR